MPHNKVNCWGPVCPVDGVRLPRGTYNPEKLATIGVWALFFGVASTMLMYELHSDWMVSSYQHGGECAPGTASEGGLLVIASYATMFAAGLVAIGGVLSLTERCRGEDRRREWLRVVVSSAITITAALGAFIPLNAKCL